MRVFTMVIDLERPNDAPLTCRELASAILVDVELRLEAGDMLQPGEAHVVHDPAGKAIGSWRVSDEPADRLY